MNRIATLEADLRRGTRRRRPTAAAPAAAVPPPAPLPAPPPAPPPALAPERTVSASVARAMSAWSGSSTRPTASRAASSGRARAFGVQLDYRVPGLPAPLRQPSGMSCWAAVGAMMTSWRDQATYSIESFLGGLGGIWAQKFAEDRGLLAHEMRAFLAAMGMQEEPALVNRSAQAYEEMLRLYGPLWMTADNRAADGVQGIHEHMLVGIHGPSDGDPTVDVIDPASGRMEALPLSQFVRRYEQLIGTPFLGLQVRHWPAGAQRAAQQSLIWAQQASQRLGHAHSAPVLAAVGAGWEVFKEVVSESNALTWTRASMRGVRLPKEDESKKPLATARDYKKGSFRSKETLAYDLGIVTDHVGAEFQVEYRYNGNCVGDVTITNSSYAPPGPLSGRRVSVDTSITGALEHETADMSAVQVEIVYSFTYVGGSHGTYVHRYVLFGDGRAPVHTREKR